MMIINCLVVDDEELARKLISEYISRIGWLIEVGQAKNALEANHFLVNNKIDLVFLDIQMPDISGLQLIKILDHKPEIIITTAYPEYALAGFELNVTDYLLKPFGFDRFLSGVNKAAEQIKLKRLAQHPNEATRYPAPAEKDFIIIKSDQKRIKLRFEDIIHIEGLKEYVSFYTQDKRIIGLYSLKELEDMLPDSFIRIHRSHIVNKNHVESLEGPFVHIANQKIPIGKSYKKEVDDKIFQ